MTMSCDDAGTEPVRRIEVFTGAGRRREWSDEARASILAESFSGSESVCAVARRHGLAPSQLFGWRRELRKRLEGQGVSLPTAAAPAPSFVPAVIDPALASAGSITAGTNDGAGAAAVGRDTPWPSRRLRNSRRQPNSCDGARP